MPLMIEKQITHTHTNKRDKHTQLLHCCTFTESFPIFAKNLQNIQPRIDAISFIIPRNFLTFLEAFKGIFKQSYNISCHFTNKNASEITLTLIPQKIASIQRLFVYYHHNLILHPRFSSLSLKSFLTNAHLKVLFSRKTKT